MSIQAALAEQSAAHEALQRQTASHVAALRERESKLSKEIRELRIASENEINGLNSRLDSALQVTCLPG